MQRGAASGAGGVGSETASASKLSALLELLGTHERREAAAVVYTPDDSAVADTNADTDADPGGLPYQGASTTNTKPPSQLVRNRRGGGDSIIEAQSGGAFSTVTEEAASSSGRIQSLLQQQKDHTQQQVEAELRSQHALEDELADLTGVLKDVTVGINRAVMEQYVTLYAIQEAVVDNAAEVQAQKKKVGEDACMHCTALYCTVLLLPRLLTYSIYCEIVCCGCNRQLLVCADGRPREECGEPHGHCGHYCYGAGSVRGHLRSHSTRAQTLEWCRAGGC
jgi:hypothetical protein